MRRCSLASLVRARRWQREGDCRARSIREAGQSLNDLACVLRDLGKLAEAETVCRQALAIRRKLLGEAHPDVARSRDLLAEVLRAQGKLAGFEKVETDNQPVTPR